MYSDPLCAPWLTVEGGFFIWAAALLCHIVTNAGSLALYAWTLGSQDSAPLPQWTSCQAGLYLYAH